MLPGTPTPTRIIRLATRTPRPTNTLAPVRGSLATQTPIPTEKCPAGLYDLSLPADPSQLPGRSYNLKDLPEGYQLVDSGPLDSGPMADADYAWVEVRWQGRSLYWIQRLVCRDEHNAAYWEIVDALALPRLDPQSGEAQTQQCFYGTQPVAGALAYGMYDPSQPTQTLEGEASGWPVQVQAAWEMNEGFSPLDVRGLSCYYAGP
jgi:hypothetical protein